MSWVGKRFLWETLDAGFPLASERRREEMGKDACCASSSFFFFFFVIIIIYFFFLPTAGLIFHSIYIPHVPQSPILGLYSHFISVYLSPKLSISLWLGLFMSDFSFLVCWYWSELPSISILVATAAALLVCHTWLLPSPWSILFFPIAINPSTLYLSALTLPFALSGFSQAKQPDLSSFLPLCSLGL